MPIICPACGSSYAVPAALAGSATGRRVRCRTCRLVFVADASDEPEPQADDASAEVASGEARTFRAARLATWVGGGGVGVALGAFAALLAVPGAVDRLAADPRLPAPATAILAQLPSNGLALLGSNASPLELAAGPVRRAMADGRTAFEVSGEIRNPTSAPRRTPAIEIVLVAEDGRALERRTLRPEEASIPAGGRLAFSSVALNAPPEATRVAFQLRPDPLDRF